jgi:hypothetical protein
MRLVYLSPVPWKSFAQRPHKFVEWFHANTKEKVLWINPYPTRLPEFGDFCRRKPDSFAHAKTPDWLQVVQPRALPVEPLPGLGAVNQAFWKPVFAEIGSFVGQRHVCLLGIGKPSGLAVQVLRTFPDLGAFYDAMDDFPAFYSGLSRWRMECNEKICAQSADRILVSSTALQRKYSVFQNKIVAIFNGCDVSSLPSASALIKPVNPPVIGYVGTIGKWFDWDIVCEIARLQKSSVIRLIGPIFESPQVCLPSNIELLPACEHAIAIKNMQTFSAGLIPFKQTKLTASVDPVKYYEYRALGLPVISTAFGEMAFREGKPGVFLAGESDLDSLVSTALSYKSTLHEIMQFRGDNDWNMRFSRCGLLS